MPTTRLTLLLAVAAAATLIAAAPAHALDLTVELTGARGAEGTVGAALYGGPEGWLKEPLRQDRTVAGERVVIVFRGLPAGTFAIAAFHDQNGNGRLDANVMGLPTEPMGFSREARGTFGPPKYDAASFELKADTTVRVVLR